MIKLKEISEKRDLLAGGHRLCAGCTASTVMRQIMLASDDPIIVTSSTGCLEVATSIYPYTAWRVPFFHSAFENSAATTAGIESMFQHLKKTGKIPKDKHINFMAVGGDGGPYDIGIQALSGSLERGHDFLYVCYDNGAYMNTGIQRSSSTPLGASTTTCPAGSHIPGKPQNRKDLTAIVAAHNVPYVAQASPSHFRDLMEKAQKAFSIRGPKFLNVIAPCHRGWRTKIDQGIELARLAVDTCFWPLYEVVDGMVHITYKPKEKKPIADWLKLQGRFSHVFKPENEHIIDTLQKRIDRDWERLLSREEQPLCR